MTVRLINIGYGNIVAVNRVIALVTPESAPIRRIIQDAKEEGMLIDATCGRRTRGVLVTDSRHVILSAIQPETIAGRLNGSKDAKVEPPEDAEPIGKK